MRVLQARSLLADDAELAAQAPSPLHKGQRIGAYELLVSLSTGGMGTVYLVRQDGARGFERLAALKTIRPTVITVPLLRQLFRDEARLQGRLNHPAITQVYDYGEDTGLAYLVMEYVPGVSFADLLRYRPDPVIAAGAIAEVCRGLYSAHSATDLSGQPLGVVHRDVSPQNLMLTFDGAVKILDFGVATVRDRQAPATRFGEIRGKPAYMSPEQLRSRRVDARSDIFAVSIVLWELLTRQRLFAGKSFYATARAVEHAEITPPSTAAGIRLPDGLEEIVMRGLARDPHQRFETAQQMAAALDQVTAGSTVLDQYAAQTLAGARTMHREWLRAVLAERSHTPRAVLTDATTFVRSPGDDTPSRTTDHEERPLAKKLAARRSVSDRPHSWARRMAWLGPSLAGLVVASLAVGFWQPRDSASETGQDKLEAHAETANSMLLPAPAIAHPAPASLAATDEAREALPRKRTGLSTKSEWKRHAHGRRGKRARRKHHKRPVARHTTHAKQSEVKEPLGRLTVSAKAAAIVRVDGVQLGPTPIVRHILPAGEHEVVLLDPQSSKVRQRRLVTISTDREQRMKFD